LRSFAHGVANTGEATFNVLAYATGAPEDPSTPRRLSLARALAARSVLISEGVQSTHIYVRALGASSTEGPADRVDVMLGGPGGTPAAPSLSPAAQSGAPASANPPGAPAAKAANP
jgi:hypothetical protein